MQLHRQLPELREGSTRRGEDLSDLGAEQHYREPGHTPRAVPPGVPSPTPGSPPASRFASRAEEPAANWGGPRLPVAARERCPRGRSNLCGRRRHGPARLRRETLPPPPPPPRSRHRRAGGSNPFNPRRKSRPPAADWFKLGSSAPHRRSDLGRFGALREGEWIHRLTSGRASLHFRQG